MDSYEKQKRKFWLYTGLIAIWGAVTPGSVIWSIVNPPPPTRMATFLLNILVAAMLGIRFIPWLWRSRRELRALASDPRPGPAVLDDSTYDWRDAIVDIQADAPGRVAGRFVDALFERYSLQAGNCGCRVDVLYTDDENPAERRRVIVRLRGHGAFGLFKRESGVHREALETMGAPAGRAVVAVLPGVDRTVVHLQPDDLLVEFSGGSAVGADEAAAGEMTVHVTHRPTGLEAVAYGVARPADLLEDALDILRARLYWQRRIGSQPAGAVPVAASRIQRGGASSK